MEDILENSHLTLRDLQAFHEWLDGEKGFDMDMFRNVAYLSGEIGEVVKAIREINWSQNEDQGREARAHMGEELADCLAYIAKLANCAGVDLQEAYVRKMKRNVTRTWPGHPRR
jgi:NTP pyrophosphatase (non-canonical NTP hydrolase)